MTLKSPNHQKFRVGTLSSEFWGFSKFLNFWTKIRSKDQRTKRVNALTLVQIGMVRVRFWIFYSGFHKIVVVRSSVCRTILIRRALEALDPGASNGGSNFIFQHFGADMEAFEVAGWLRISDPGRSRESRF